MIENQKTRDDVLVERTGNVRRSDSAIAPMSGRRRRRGLTAIEYCFMLSLIMLASLFAIQHLGNMMKASFEVTASKMPDNGP